MGSGLFFPICALPFNILILCLFFQKGHIKNEETRIYSYLIITNFIGLFIEIMCTFGSLIYNEYQLISNIIYKSYLAYLIIWIGLFLSYIQSISTNNDSEKNKKVKIFLRILLLIEIMIVYLLPIELIVTDDFSTRYTIGSSVNFAYIISGIDILIIIIMLIKNFRKIKNSKYLPTFLFLGIGLVAILIQSVYPYLLLMTYVETFISSVMYFTIENPDLKLISELNVAKAEAERANNAKSEFLKNMSHEIATPINKAKGMNYLSMEATSLEEAKENALVVDEYLTELSDISKNIIDVIKLESNSLTLEENVYYPSKLLEDIEKLVIHKIAEKNIKFKINKSKLPKALYGDASKIKHIITELINNAIKYTEKGSITLKITSTKENNKCILYVEVKDTGIGIKKEHQKALFNNFERVDLDKNITKKGMGLGLSICKELVELMNGKINVESEYGKGSKFTFSIEQTLMEAK